MYKPLDVILNFFLGMSINCLDVLILDFNSSAYCCMHDDADANF